MNLSGRQRQKCILFSPNYTLDHFLAFVYLSQVTHTDLDVFSPYHKFYHTAYVLPHALKKKIRKFLQDRSLIITQTWNVVKWQSSCLECLDALGLTPSIEKQIITHIWKILDYKDKIFKEI